MRAKRDLVASVALGVVCGFMATTPSSARADGAFPDSMAVLLPGDRPDSIILGTNFGLILSADAGQTWQWVCEHDDGFAATLYAVGPPPRDRLYAVAQGLVVSDDGACTWTDPRAGDASPHAAADVFPDPTNADRVYIAGVAADTYGNVVLRSDDAGTSTGTIIFRAPGDDVIEGVESARSDPLTIYVARERPAPTSGVFLARSRDGGVTWTDVASGVALPAGAFGAGIIAVAPDDPLTILLRVYTLDGERAVVSHDGGVTFTLIRALGMPGRFTSFVARANGTWLLGALEGANGIVLASSDQGVTWTPWAHPPHPKAMAERAGTLFVSGDDTADGFSLAASSRGADEDGSGLVPLMRFADVRGTSACVAASCMDVCAYEVRINLFSPSVCPAPLDASVIDDAGDDGAALGPPSSPGGGCSCAFIRQRPRTRPDLVLGLFGAILAIVRARLFRRR